MTGLGQKCLHVYSPYKDQTIHRSRAVCIAIPTKGVNIVPLMAVSLGLTGGLALDTKARRPAWRFFARAEAVVSYSSGLCLLRLPVEMTRPALYSKWASVKSSMPIPAQELDSERTHPMRSTYGAADAPAAVGLVLRKA